MGYRNSPMIRTFMTLVAAAAVSVVVHAKEINDIDVDDVFEMGDQQLVLNGAGARSKFFLDVYVAALYLKNNQTDAQQIVDADEPMAIRLYITSDLITSKRMAGSTRDGFIRSTDGDIKGKNQTPKNREPKT